MAELEVEEIGGSAAGALEAVRDEWSALCDRCRWTTPFQRPEWLLPWCRRLGPAEPWILALRRGGRLVGLAPLFVYDRPGSEGRRERTVAPLGAGLSDYLDVLLEPEAEREGAAALFSHLAAHPERWDACDLERLRPGSPLLETAVPAGWPDAIEIQDPSPILGLPERVEDLAAVVPAGQLRSLRAFRSRAARRAPLRFVRAGSEEERDQLFAALVRLHGERWRSRGAPGVLDDPRVRALHREALAGFAARGALALYGLVGESGPVAVYYGFREQDCFYSYLQGFDPAWARWSPGVLIVGAAIEEAVRGGARRFDFLRGAEPYKHAWGARDVEVRRRRFRHGGDSLHPRKAESFPMRVLLGTFVNEAGEARPFRIADGGLVNIKNAKLNLFYQLSARILPDGQAEVTLRKLAGADTTLAVAEDKRVSPLDGTVQRSPLAPFGFSLTDTATHRAVVHHGPPPSDGIACCIDCGEGWVVCCGVEVYEPGWGACCSIDTSCAWCEVCEIWIE